MHLVKMTMKWPSSMISRGPKMFRYKIHWKLTLVEVQITFIFSNAFFNKLGEKEEVFNVIARY